MIDKIAVGLSSVNYFKNYILNDRKFYNFSENQNYSTVPQGLSLNYFVPFGAKFSNSENKSSKLENILYYSDTPTKKLISNLKKEAKNEGFANVTTLHVIRHSLNELTDYIDKLEAGQEDLQNPKYLPDMVDVILEETSEDIFTNPNFRNGLKDIIQNTKININLASLSELQTLDGIGEAKAQSIIDYRNQVGLFKDISELMNVSGIGETVFAKIKDNITI